MASKPVFYNPDDPLGINALLGIAAGDPLTWHVQTNNPTTSRELSVALGGDGDGFGDGTGQRVHNQRSAVTTTYKCYATAGFLKLPSVGELTGGHHIDTVNLVYSPTDWPTLTVTSHRHDGGTGSHGVATGDTCRTYSPGVSFPAQFCIPTLLNNGAAPPVKQFEMSNPGIGMRSLAYDLACTHVDETDGCGEWLAGENHDGVETLTAEFTGSPEGAELTYAASWTNTADGKTEGNTQVNTRSVTLVRHIRHDTAA